MRTNWETALVGERAVLVPYRRKFVRRYHEWMKDPFLQEMTASEPLSLAEEYAMQASWRDDPKKCTFIVLDKALPGAEAFKTDAMAGDVNLFLNDPDDDRSVAEIEVMIAEAGSRRKGLGREAVRLMIAYGAEVLSIRRFYCKINEANAASIAMFRGLGYVQVNYVPAFKEIEFEFLVPVSFKDGGPSSSSLSRGDDCSAALGSADDEWRRLVSSLRQEAYVEKEEEEE